VLDRHAAPDNERRNKVACIWESEDGEIREVTYHELHRQANKVANALEERGIEKGDTVGLYMPMVPEVTSILYGCFEVGAIAVPIFSGFGVDATATRIEDPECSVLFTGDGFQRRGQEVTLKATTDEAIEQAGHVERTIVYDRLGLRRTGRFPGTTTATNTGRKLSKPGRRVRDEIAPLRSGVDAAVFVGHDGQAERYRSHSFGRAHAGRQGTALRVRSETV